MSLAPSLPSRLEIETKIEFLLAGSVRAYSPVHPLSLAEKRAFVTGKNRPALGVRYGLYPALLHELTWASGEEANSVARSLFGAPLPGLAGRARVASRNDQSMVDPYHARVISRHMAKGGLHVRFLIHQWTGLAWDQTPDHTVGWGTAILAKNVAGGWRVIGYRARLTERWPG